MWILENPSPASKNSHVIKIKGSVKVGRPSGCNAAVIAANAMGVTSIANII